ncbi:hypothetical protein Q5P01_010971 [Channa striata]|uniref:F5/8 type C domain-containing protein n=1 Tax=Channa striata TaxID=64152 RepID=A0AA88MWM5_CHASR|nr:hypothetical protein Q5P01_010971 [Channa striata]
MTTSLTYDLQIVIAISVAMSPTSYINIAKGGKVTQSSLYGDAVPQRAIDGNRASNREEGSCAHTQKDLNPWWRLDLCSRLKSKLSPSPTEKTAALKGSMELRSTCAVISTIEAGVSKTFDCNGMEGQYVNVVIAGKQEFLTLCEVEVTGHPSNNTAPTETNIATVGKVTQSSLYGDAVPQLAIDGNRASNREEGSCAHTQKDLNPWWRLDLLQPFKIKTVTITNRKDCCSERLNGAEIHVGNSLYDNGNANPVCAVISSIDAGASKTFDCNGMEGQFVNVVIPGKQEFLTLCEVEVTGQPSNINIAKCGKVTQSSLYGDAVPERAIDGNRASNREEGSCAHTQKDLNPWWRLDLLEPFKIKTVTITNREDCCSERLNGAEIRVGNSLDNDGNANPVCAVISSIEAGASKTFDCNGMEGQFVNVVIPGKQEFLTLCEVEVTGHPSNNSDINIAKGGKVTQSSLYGDAVPQRAIDGNRASKWKEHSCAHTQKDLNPWWRLDLLQPFKIKTVTITNREDCCSERLNGAEIRIGNSLDNNGNVNPVCTVISSIPAGSSQNFDCHGMEGQYVNIVIPGMQQYLTLCEVEVFGGKVSQSSVFENAIPEKAIDGNRASKWVEGSCTHTQHDQNPWWRLDLLKTYQIKTVTITNRQDCCPERLFGAEIRIGNSLSDNGNINPRCAVISSIEAGDSKTFDCNGMEGQYVNIVIPGRQEYLTLCEVEVTGQPASVNIAKGGKVSQSSVLENAIPEKAIDGNRASNWVEGSCAHTQDDFSPWWRLDLLKKYNIHAVTITNRKDCCAQRLNGAEIHIGNSLADNGNTNPVCTVISSIPAGTSQTFVCNAMEGRYINIVIHGKQQFLTLCEVEVFGTVSNTSHEDICG